MILVLQTAAAIFDDMTWQQCILILERYNVIAPAYTYRTQPWTQPHHDGYCNTHHNSENSHIINCKVWCKINTRKRLANNRNPRHRNTFADATIATSGHIPIVSLTFCHIWHAGIYIRYIYSDYISWPYVAAYRHLKWWYAHRPESEHKRL